MIGAYQVVKRIGQGSFATVYKGYHAQTQEIVAIKRISIEDLQHEKSARREIDSLTALGKCSHPNIVNLVDVVPGNKHTYLIMEYCDGGDMKQYLRTHALSERDVRYFFVQIVRGLRFLERSQIVHRDLKPQNLLLTAGTPPVLKIADFGFARAVSAASLAQTTCGSPLYMAPEIFAHQPYGSSADMWSLGAIAYEMMYRRPPLNAKTHVELASMLNALRTSPLQLPLQPAVSADFAVVLAGLLTHAARARLTLDGLWRTHFVCKGWAEAKILQESEQRCKLDVLRSPSVPPTRPDLVESSYVYVNPARSSDQVAHTPTKWGEALAQDPCRIRTFHNVRSDRRLRKFVKVLAKREGGANVRHAWAVSPHGRRPRDAWEYIAGGSRHAAKLFLHMSPREQKDCVDSLDMARVWPEVRVGAMLNVAKLLTCRGQCVSQLAEERAAAGEQHALAEAASLHMSALSAHSRALDALIVCANQIAQLQSHSNSDAPAQGSHAQRWSDLLWLATQCEPVSPAAKQLVGAMTQSASRAKELLGQLGDRARATDANRVMYEAAMHRARAGALSESSKEWVPAGALSEALVHYENSLLLVEVLASTDCVGQDERLQDLADLLSERILHARLAP